ncbi:MAG: hypothetical protein A4E38_00098 [Methanoregulaceae archaeon PtaB.Bin108]|nr:MAG: hypothetical protein A4E38_00098 [Methanoregulaceae archaeon PtaB.Bin108]
MADILRDLFRLTFPIAGIVDNKRKTDMPFAGGRPDPPGNE